MLLSLDGRRVYFDLAGPQNATGDLLHPFAESDSGMWAEQLVPPAGSRLSRAAARHARPWRQRAGRRRLHDGPARGRRERCARCAGHREDPLHRSVDRRHDGQGFALANPASLLSLCLCDTQPSTPPGSTATWDDRKAAVRTKGTASIADGTMDRWFTPEFKKCEPGALARDPRHDQRHDIPGLDRCMSAIQQFDYLERLSTIKAPTLVICGDEGRGHAADRNKLIASKIPNGRYEGIAQCAPSAQRRAAPEPFNRIMMSWLAANR